MQIFYSFDKFRWWTSKKIHEQLRSMVSVGLGHRKNMFFLPPISEPEVARIELACTWVVSLFHAVANAIASGAIRTDLRCQCSVFSFIRLMQQIFVFGWSGHVHVGKPIAAFGNVRIRCWFSSYKWRELLTLHRTFGSWGSKDHSQGTEWGGGKKGILFFFFGGGPKKIFL